MRVSRPGWLPSVSEEEKALPPEDTVRHGLQIGRPAGSEIGAEQQVLL